MKNTLAISNNNLQIFAYDISLVGGNYKGDLQITFNLGTKYDNKQVTVLHKKQNNEIETFEQKVVNGKTRNSKNWNTRYNIYHNSSCNNISSRNNSNNKKETIKTLKYKWTGKNKASPIFKGGAKSEEIKTHKVKK